MAFAATVFGTAYLGPAKTKLWGSWSGVQGDTAGSMAIAGTVTQANFYKYDTGQTWQFIPRVTTAVASGISTITINNQDDVTTGYFEIEKLG